MEYIRYIIIEGYIELSVIPSNNVGSARSNNFLYNAEIEGIKIYSDNGIDYIYMMFKQQDATFSRIYRYPVQ